MRKEIEQIIRAAYPMNDFTTIDCINANKVREDLGLSKIEGVDIPRIAQLIYDGMPSRGIVDVHYRGRVSDYENCYKIYLVTPRLLQGEVRKVTGGGVSYREIEEFMNVGDSVYMMVISISSFGPYAKVFWKVITKGEVMIKSSTEPPTKECSKLLGEVKPLLWKSGIELLDWKELDEKVEWMSVEGATGDWIGNEKPSVQMCLFSELGL